MTIFNENKVCRRVSLRLFISVMASVTAFLLVSAPAMAEEQFPEEDGPLWNDRYAVALYGIRHDRYADQNGNEAGIAGLTFGPATGKLYLDKTRSHVTQKEYEEDPVENICLHWMTWEEIADQSLKDPTVFHACLVRGCTHAVDLKLNSTLLSKDYSSKITGDGVGAILDGVKRPFLCWNSGRRCSGGWPACRVRAVLNGADENFNPNVAGEEYRLTPEESLFSCFPQELQKRIVAKVVVSDLGNDLTKRMCVTTCDKLWLFSASELYGGSCRAEGEPYERARMISSGEAGFAGGHLMYSETGNEVWAWIRSISPFSEVINRHIYGGGHDTGSEYYNTYGLAPGFCLP